MLNYVRDSAVRFLLDRTFLWKVPGPYASVLRCIEPLIVLGPWSIRLLSFLLALKKEYECALLFIVHGQLKARL